jgi:hypothetical protein
LYPPLVDLGRLDSSLRAVTASKERGRSAKRMTNVEQRKKTGQINGNHGAGGRKLCAAILYKERHLIERTP